MADVYLAVAVGPAGFNKLLVIKRLRQNLTDEPELRAMFLDEARLAARLNHRNVVQTNEVGVTDEKYFIAMEYLDGQPLNRVFARARQEKSEVPLGIALHILCDVLAGLQYAHDLEDYDGSPLHVVHRDISPQNVFVTYDGQTKIVDFGIARGAADGGDAGRGAQGQGLVHGAGAGLLALVRHRRARRRVLGRRDAVGGHCGQAPLAGPR